MSIFLPSRLLAFSSSCLLVFLPSCLLVFLPSCLLVPLINFSPQHPHIVPPQDSKNAFFVLFKTNIAVKYAIFLRNQIYF